MKYDLIFSFTYAVAPRTGRDQDGNPKYAEEEVTPSTGLLGVYLLLQVSGKFRNPATCKRSSCRSLVPAVLFPFDTSRPLTYSLPLGM